MKPGKNILVLVLLGALLLVFHSCVIEKRRYRPGFYTNWITPQKLPEPLPPVSPEPTPAPLVVATDEIIDAGHSVSVISDTSVSSDKNDSLIKKKHSGFVHGMLKALDAVPDTIRNEDGQVEKIVLKKPDGFGIASMLCAFSLPILILVGNLFPPIGFLFFFFLAGSLVFGAISFFSKKKKKRFHPVFAWTGIIVGLTVILLFVLFMLVLFLFLLLGGFSEG